jgi:hypothetical protein
MYATCSSENGVSSRAAWKTSHDDIIMFSLKNQLSLALSEDVTTRQLQLLWWPRTEVGGQNGCLERPMTYLWKYFLLDVYATHSNSRTTKNVKSLCNTLLFDASYTAPSSCPGHCCHRQKKQISQSFKTGCENCTLASSIEENRFEFRMYPVPSLEIHTFCMHRTLSKTVPFPALKCQRNIARCSNEFLLSTK